MYVVYRKGDDKVLKSVNYSPASLGEIIYNKPTQSQNTESAINITATNVEQPTPIVGVRNDGNVGGLGNVYQ